MDEGDEESKESGNAASWLTRIDPSLARGFVRQETRQIIAGHAAVQRIPAELDKMIEPIRVRPLSERELGAFAEDFNRKAAGAFNSVYSHVKPSKPGIARPGWRRYEIVHYLVKAEEQRPVDGRTPMDRTMRLSVFTAQLGRRLITMSLRETPVCFFEHAARRYLVRGGQEHEAAVRTIAQRLAETIVLPVLAMKVDGRAVTGSELAIPLTGGLLLGGFVHRPSSRGAAGSVGGFVTYDQKGRRPREVPLGIATDYVIRTYVNPDRLGADQRAIVREVEAWLAGHRGEAETVMLHQYRMHLKNRQAWLRDDVFKALEADFRAMRNRVFGSPPSRSPPPHMARFLPVWRGRTDPTKEGE